MRHSPRIVLSLLASALALAVFAGAAAGQPPTTTTTPTTTVPPTTTTTVPPPPPPPPPPGPVVLHYLPLSGGTLAEGNNGGEIFLMQISLVVRGFWLSDFPGHFGASTRHGLTAFQKYMGLPRTGRLDALTRFVLGATVDRAVPTYLNGGRYVDADLGRQVLIVADSGTSVWVFDISSGKPSTPTPRGSFRLSRQINGLRVSALGVLWRPKYFTGGYALHGSPSVPTYAASHGCVRMTNQEIDFIWASGILPLGTPIRLH